jgi:hypothetical protein
MEEPGSGREQPFVTHDEAPTVPSPGKRPLDDPSPPIALPLVALLMGGALLGTPGGEDRRNAPPCQARPPGVAISTASRHQALGPLAGPPRLARAPDRDGVERPLAAGDCRRGRRLQGRLSAEDPRHRPAPATVSPSRVSSGRRGLPLFLRHTTPLGTACIPPDLWLVVEVGPKSPPPLAQPAYLCPVFEPAPAGSGTAIPAGQLAPLGTRPQPPADAFNAASILHTRASPAGGNVDLGKLGADRVPWLRGQVSPRHRLPSRVAWQHMT